MRQEVIVAEQSIGQFLIEQIESVQQVVFVIIHKLLMDGAANAPAAIPEVLYREKVAWSDFYSSHP